MTTNEADAVVHIVEDFNEFIEPSIVIALCAETALINFKGEITPSSYDFVLKGGSVQDATCLRCIARDSQAVADKSKLVKLRAFLSRRRGDER